MSSPRRFLPIAALAILFATVAWQAPRADDVAAERARWVAQTLQQMTLDQKLGQLVMVFYYGGFTAADSDEYQQLLRRVEKQHIGGIVVSTRPGALGTQLSQAYPTAAMANQLQRRARVPLLVAADFERGTTMRIAEGTSFPYAMAVAATGKPEDAYTMGRITALEARAVGVHWIFAPVADVNVNPDNPIINTRSFGEDPQRVAAFVREFVRGVERNGAMATAKHFPGHGDTGMDSHINLPTITAERERLERVELLPFRAAVEAGVSAVMTGHLLVPALEPDPATPSTFSPRIMRDLLRHQMRFRGLIVTDALEMGGMMANFSVGETAVRAFESGADVLLVPPVPDAVLLALREAAQSKRLPIARVNESVRRILEAKARLGLHRRREVSLDTLNRSFRKREFVDAAQDIADRGVTLLRDDAKLLPLDATKPQRVLLAAIAGDPDPLPGTDLEREIRWRVEQLDVVRADTRFVKPEFVKLPPPENYDVAVVALFVRVADRKGTVGLPAEQAALVSQLLAAGKPVVVAAFGSPYLIERFPDAKTWLASFSTFGISQVAVARTLFGQVAVGGQMPVSVPGVAQVGDGLRVAASPMKLQPSPAEMAAKLALALASIEKLVAEKTISGGVLAVGHRGQLAVRVLGKAGFEVGARDVSADMTLDIGALARPIATGTSVALLMGEGLIRLDAPVATYLPEWAHGPQPEWRSLVTVRHLLMHTSGLPDDGGWLRKTKDSAAAVREVCAKPLAFEPGTKTEPSELGVILLEEIIRRTGGVTHGEFARRRILAPLGMSAATFRGWRVAPGVTTGTYVGFVSTAPDLAAYAQMMLNGGLYGHRRILRRATIDLFTSRQAVAGTVRALGWDVGPWNGQTLSRRAYGTDAESGASLWIDPDKELFVIFLPAAVAPEAKEKVRALRDELHKAVAEALGLAAPTAPQAPPSSRQ